MGSAISGHSTLLDVAPSILGLMGWKAASGMKGRDILKNPIRDDSSTYLETFTPQAYYDRISLIRRPWHLILTPKLQSYELDKIRENTLEIHNVYGENKSNEESSEMVKEINRLSRDILFKKSEQTQDSDARDILRSLGYSK